ncbi:MAG: MmcQ/YjbR family DNA-binding protein [Phycisphaerae bacterium]|nr:MmcQ/YjbR family DNA-binding protein [Phycisphaerae bacterium]NIP56220.1 MmcQ/YjbR family DNA-binding protein [Phycisphaerae bacterium]NIW50544.1 MmcQ/YjbR family DNA-binding protein [Gammaproteobacteria bacterium]NIX32470.1 MmcQ/YjbR family DNA-binding protein [Phycisphaerae bacterium]
MDRQTLYRYILKKKGAFEDRPFGPDTAVFKVMGKMFALVGDNEPLAVNLKCDPDEAVFLRQMYFAVQPGYHMNKRHWNTVTIDGSIPDEEIRQMVDSSYNLVVKGLKKADREALAEL